MSFQCWGANNFGQSETIQFTESTIVHGLYASYDNTCIVYENTGLSQILKVSCFGKNTNNQLSIPLAYSSIINSYIYIAIGLDSICGIVSATDGDDSELEPSILCWGYCLNGICDIPLYLTRPFMVSVGVDHACSITDENIHLNYGSVGCWGVNLYGQLYVPEIFRRYTIQVAVGDSISCALAVNYYIQCWGDVGNDIPDVVNSYTRMVSTGGRHSCKYDTKLICYGNDEYQQLEVPVDHKINSIETSAGWDYTCSINLDMKISCWGFNYLGQIDIPIKLHKQNNDQYPFILDIATGLSHSCAVWRETPADLNRLTCWGGHSEFGETHVPSRLAREPSLVAVGDWHSCALQSLGNAYEVTLPNVGCWGANELGQAEVPGRVRDYDVLQLVAGGAHTCARVRSSLVCWGSDSQGQLAVDRAVRSSVYAAAAGTAHTCVIYMNPDSNADSGDNNGMTEVRCYGKYMQAVVEKEGRLLDTGFEHSCMVDLSGETYCWGDDEYGQLMCRGERRA